MLEGPSQRPEPEHAETTQDPERASAEVRRPGNNVKKEETETLKDGGTKKAVTVDLEKETGFQRTENKRKSEEEERKEKPES